MICWIDNPLFKEVNAIVLTSEEARQLAMNLVDASDEADDHGSFLLEVRSRSTSPIFLTVDVMKTVDGIKEKT